MANFKTSLTVTHKIFGSAPFLFEGTFPDGIKKAEELGYDCVELHINKTEELNDPTLYEALASSPVTVSALGTGRLYVNDGLSLTDPESSIRDQAMKELKKFIDAAEKLHCIVILGCIRGNIPSPEERDNVFARLAASMKELDQYAGSKNVKMVFEPINRYENNYLCNFDETASFIHENNLEHTGILMDTFHMNIEEADVIGSIEKHGKDIAYVHIADSNRLYPGGGHMDFPLILKTLKEQGYSGVLSAECLPLPSKEEVQTAWLQAVKEIID